MTNVEGSRVVQVVSKPPAEEGVCQTGLAGSLTSEYDQFPPEDTHQLLLTEAVILVVARPGLVDRVLTDRPQARDSGYEESEECLIHKILFGFGLDTESHICCTATPSTLTSSRASLEFQAGVAQIHNFFVFIFLFISRDIKG